MDASPEALDYASSENSDTSDLSDMLRSTVIGDESESAHHVENRKAAEEKKPIKKVVEQTIYFYQVIFRH